MRSLASIRLNRLVSAVMLTLVASLVLDVDRVTATPRLKHVWVVVLENHSTGQILGNRNAPYLNLLARHHGLASRYFSIRHPSLPNYLALISGSTQGCRSDRCRPGYRGPTLARQLRNHGLTWRGYFQGLPHVGYVGEDRGQYIRHHNPFAYFSSIIHSPARRNLLPLARLTQGLRRPPAFSLVIPDNQHNMHDGSVRSSDRWLHAWIPKIMRSRGFHQGGVIFITFDEGRHDSTGCCMPGIHGGRTPLIAITPHRRHVTLRHPRTAYSLLRTIENGFRLAPLGLARQVVPLNGFWRSPG